MDAGKTTLLRNLLENTKLKIGCIVNDVAAINIDAKLIRNDRTRENGPNSTSDLADTIELANGCACELCLHWCAVLCMSRCLQKLKKISTLTLHGHLLEQHALPTMAPCSVSQQPIVFAGCSIQDELFASFEQLLTLADRKGSKYDW